MVKRFLVTTALEETWPAVDVPVLFLGEWCRLYDRKLSWENLDAVVAPYHWDDREKLYNDYQYLQHLYEDLLQELADKLNQIHGVNHSIRYWRIIVGPWLGYFIQMLFDRWAMLRLVLNNNDICGVRVLEEKTENLVPNDMEDFVNLFLSDKWNELIYAQLLEKMGVSVEKIAIDEDVPSQRQPSHGVSFARKFKRATAKVASRFLGFLGRSSDYFFIGSYLPLKQDLLLQLRLGQLPQLWRPVKSPSISVNQAMRHWQLSAHVNEDDFAAIACTMISRHIPKVYLEGYRELLEFCEELQWPKSPRAIFTSVSFMLDDVFKAWSAPLIEGGKPLVIGQHGGNYGMSLWGFTEDHQLAICDKYISWGWELEGISKISPVGNIKGFTKQIKYSKEGGALLVELIVPRYSYHMYSMPVAGQLLDYLEDQYRFVQALPIALRDKVVVRLSPSDLGWSMKKRWEDHFPQIKIDVGIQPLSSLIAKSRLYISTYNATTYLESLSNDIPTIIFWNPSHSELRESAIPYFDLLRSVGIFHETPESAARQMASVWDDVSGWWHSVEVQSVRKAFCEKYAHTPEAPLEMLEKLFREQANGKASGRGV